MRLKAFPPLPSNFIALAMLSFLPAHGWAADQASPDLVHEAVHSVGLTTLLNAMAKQEAASLPRATNANTEIVTVQHMNKDDKNIIYYGMRLPNVDVRKVTKQDIERANKESKMVDINELCFSPVHGTLINSYPVIYRYSYHDAEMRFIHGYDIDRASCLKAGVQGEQMGTDLFSSNTFRK